MSSSKKVLPTLKKKKQGGGGGGGGGSGKRPALRQGSSGGGGGSGSKKRKLNKEDSDHDDSDDDDDDSDDDEVDVSKTIGQTEDITFEFSDMKEDYFAGVRMILNSVIANPANTLPLTEAIIQQDTVGTVVNCEGEVDVFAYATIMPLDLLQDTSFFKFLRNHFQKLTSSSSSSSSQQQEITEMLNFLQDDSMGMFLQGRFSNLPLPLIYQLHHNLQLDIEWTKMYKMGSVKNAEEVDEPLIAKFKKVMQLLYFAPVTMEDAHVDTKRNLVGASNVYFDNFEDECYFSNASHAYVVENTGDFFKSKKFVLMVVPLKKLNKIVDEIKHLTNAE